MDSIRIQNLKCLADTSVLALKPLSLLVGANSSGKSTFLRVFPLFKQSLGVRTRGPVLWYGNEVDFGSFSVAKKRGSDSIRFTFSYSDKPNLPYFYSIFANNQLQFSFSVKSQGEVDYIDSLSISLAKYISVELKFSKSYSDVKLLINNRDYSNHSDFRIRAIESANILPNIVLVPRDGNKKTILSERDIILKLSSTFSESLGSTIDASSVFEKLIRKSIDLSSEEEFLSSLEKVFSLPENFLASWSGERKTELIDNFILYSIEDIVGLLNFLLREDFGDVSYVKPIRASAERYYRMQNLAVNELDSDGHNMAVFLHEILKNKKQKESFQGWTNKYFNFIVDTKVSEGHISVVLKYNSDKNSDNIADMGFGYSQILPILIVLWKHSSLGVNRRTPLSKHTVAIEQPELHLHPLMQARFADALMSTIKIAEENSFPVRFIIETHSKVIINRIGIRIAEGAFDENNTAIYLFENDNQSSTASVRSASFSKDGILNDWPIGFFDPVVSDDVL